MNEDAFARRFYADRSELESLRIQLTVERPGRRGGRAGELLAAPGELPPAGDRVHRQGARGAADGAEPARRRIRLRRAAAAGAAADHLGPPEPAARARAALGGARHHRLGRRPRALGAPGEGRDGDLPQQDDRLRLLHDGARRGRARAAWIPTTCCSRAGSSTCSATRTSARRSACSASRASAARSPTRRRPSTTSAGPADFDPRAYANRADWQLGEERGVAEILISERIAWQIERHFGRYGEIGDPSGTSEAKHGDRRLPDRLLEPAQPRLVGARARRERAPAGARRS